MEITRKRFATLLIALTVIASLLTGTVVYVIAQSTTNTAYLEEGVYPGSTTYTIWRDGSTYYAKDAYGHIPSWGVSSNASYVIQTALDTSHGVHVFLSRDEYVIPNTLILSTEDVLEGSGRGIGAWSGYLGYSTRLRSTITDGTPVISTYGESGVTALYGVTIKNLGIEGNGLEGDAIYFEYNVRNCFVDSVNIMSVGGDGIHFYHCFGSQIRYCHIIDCDNGINLEYNSHSIQLVGNTVRQCTEYGLLQDGSAQLSVLGGNYQNSDLADIYIRKGNGATITGVYFENNNPGIYQLYINSTTAYGAHTVSVDGCYFNGATVAGGVYVGHAINTVVSSCHFESCGTQALRVSTDAKWTVLLNIYLSASWIDDDGDGTTLIMGSDYYIQFARINHPNTATWNGNQTGRMWFCNTHSAIEYWDGSAVVTP